MVDAYLALANYAAAKKSRIDSTWIGLLQLQFNIIPWSCMIHATPDFCHSPNNTSMNA